MFTGIIADVGKVEKCGVSGISLLTVLDDIHKGDSVSVNGVCLTVAKLADKRGKLLLDFDYSPETKARTNIGDLKSGSTVNLERALRVGDRFGGHIMTGHIEGTAKLMSREQKKDSWVLVFSLDESMRKYVVSKGSIGVDGISLTVVDSERSIFSVSVIPYTLSNTNLGTRLPGDRVNIEPDILAKYVEHMIGNVDSKTITGEFLRTHGFIH
jgi:riboflavin synthase